MQLQNYNFCDGVEESVVFARRTISRPGGHSQRQEDIFGKSSCEESDSAVIVLSELFVAAASTVRVVNITRAL